MITESELIKINNERRRKGLALLTKQQANSAIYNQREERNGRVDASFNVVDFLIGYETGVGFSTEGMLGAAMHPQQQPDYSPSTSYAPDSSPSVSSPDPSPAPSFDGGSVSSGSGDSGGGL